MNLYAPSYYNSFSCIADKCRHSCCIGWEIDVDPETLTRYENCSPPYGRVIRDSISYEGDPHFRLAEHEKCPHLDGRGLCKIILELGEDHLCDICKEHPRFYHETARGREVGLGMACEEACRLILSTSDYRTFVTVGKDEEEQTPIFFDTLPHREKLYAILSDGTEDYSERIGNICNTYGVTPAHCSDKSWRELLASLEYLDEAHKELFSCYSSAFSVPPGAETAMERILAYLIFRHITPAWSVEDFRAGLGFCLFCHQLLASMAKTHPSHSLPDLARILSEELEYSVDNTDAIKELFY